MLTIGRRHARWVGHVLHEWPWHVTAGRPGRCHSWHHMLFETKQKVRCANCRLTREEDVPADSIADRRIHIPAARLERQSLLRMMVVAWEVGHEVPCVESAAGVDAVEGGTSARTAFRCKATLRLGVKARQDLEAACEWRKRTNS